MKSIFTRLAVVGIATAVSSPQLGCNLAPPYHRPTQETPSAYKELTPADFKTTDGWKVAQPRDTALRGKWWEIFNDPQLNSLEEKVSIANQSVASANAAYLAARALVKEAQSQLFPTVTANVGLTYARAPGGNGANTTYSLPFDASWTPDFWGSVRNSIYAASFAAQSSAANLENTRLTFQAELAEDYFSLRGQDSLQQILDATVKADQQTLDLTKSLYATGIQDNLAVVQAQSQLDAIQAQDAAVAIQRADYEHAIALLIGKPASSFALPAGPLKVNPPAIPLGVPSQLLERRPDIAAAERLVAQANVQIGIARAAYFPTVTLTASAGFQSNSSGSWLTWPSRFFSVGPEASEVIFDAGLRQATVQQDIQQYNEAVANYRQTVLTAFQQTEDGLAALRVLSVELQHQNAAVKSSQENLAHELDRYKLGLDPYLDVLVAQQTLLSDQQTQVSLQIQQMTASGGLIEALGGGWNASQIP